MDNAEKSGSSESGPDMPAGATNTGRRRASTLDCNAAPQAPPPGPQPHEGPSPASSATRSVGGGVSPASREQDSPISPGSSARVFPVRSVVSVVSVEPTPTPSRFTAVEGQAQTPYASSRSSSCHSVTRRQASLTGPPSSTSSSAAPPTAQPTELPSGTRRRISFDLSATRPRVGGTDGHAESPVPKSNYLDSLMKHSHGAGGSTSDSVTSTAGEGRAADAASLSAGSTKSATHDASTGEGFITTRFRHVKTPDGHAIITGLDGDSIQRCEDEPIHTPGAVQGFGLLIALREETAGKFVVRTVSENSERIIGYSPKALFRLENFLGILSKDQQDNVLDHIDFVRDGEADPVANGPEVFIMSVRPPGRRSVKLWCAMHVNNTNPDLIICEFELEDDQINPLFPGGRGSTPEEPEDTLMSDPTAEEYEESTSTVSKPLRVLRRARKRNGEAAAMEVFNIMAQVQEQLASAPNLERFLKVLVGVVKELTGFHRTMIYQFDSAWNGKVVAELVDPRATRDLYKGLHFPASDIPKQARDLYKVNRVRLLYDRDQPTARLVCRTMEDLECPLDLTYSYLRAMSPIHVKYLANMAVRASMSISINAFDELWGLIACHSYGPKGMRVSFPIRKMCRLVGDSASRNIERLSYASRLQARKLINTVPTTHNPSGYIVASSEDLLQLFDADFGVLAIRDETKILGKVEYSQEALAMLEYIRLRRISSVISSHDIREDFPDLRYPPGFQVVAGLLLVPLSVSGEDFIVFFRRSQLKYVRWAGNPYEKSVKEGTESYLEPRKSFKAWTETVVGKCREWTEEQIETAAVLCLVYGKFIAVWRQKEAALERSQLTRLLLANSAHEVRTPLNAVINYLEIALEGNLDLDTREYLSKSHSASKSLICVINDLLDLTKTEEGQALIKDEIFDLSATVQDASDVFSGETARKKLQLDVVKGPNLPPLVVGDQRRVRQAVSNLLTNAVQHTAAGGVRVELAVSRQYDDRVEIDIVVEDTGAGMTTGQLDALFREMEQVQTYESILDPGKDHHGPMQLQSQAEQSADKDKKALGLGLATVARIVKNMEGQLRLKSEPGKGSRFVMQLPFFLPAEPRESAVASPPLPALPPDPKTPPHVAGEVMLVAHTSPRPGVSRPGSIRRQGSSESKHSLTSVRSHSSVRSEVDRLIGTIQEPQMVSLLSATDSAGRKGSLPDLSVVTAQQQRDSAVQSPSSQRTRLSVSREADMSPTRPLPGGELIQDSVTPLRAVRIRDGYGSPTRGRRVSLEGPSRSPARLEPGTRRSSSSGQLSVLVAEDDPINSKIVKKRLERFGHGVTLTVNGEECARAYEKDAPGFDVILMDIQMPIVDGTTSTKMIRSYERSSSSATEPLTTITSHARSTYHVPIFAVSASLVERDREHYMATGFDGWILKPIDFESLQRLLTGIFDRDSRTRCVYTPGKWERGGWFTDRTTTTTTPRNSVSSKDRGSHAPHHHQQQSQPQPPPPFVPSVPSSTQQRDFAIEAASSSSTSQHQHHQQQRQQQRGASVSSTERVFN